MENLIGLAAGRLDDLAVSREPIAFDAVRQALSASYCLLFAERVIDRQVLAPMVEGVDPAYGDRLKMAAVEQLLPKWLSGLHEGIVVDRAALQRDHAFSRSEFYNYVIRPEGRFHCLIATPYITPTRRYHLIVGRPARTADFTPAEVVILRVLLPHVARLITLANDAALAVERCSELVAAFDSLADSVAIISDTGELQFANTGARRVLALGDGLRLTGTKLKAMTTEATAALLSAIAQVTAACGPDEIALYVPRPSGTPPYHLSLRRIGSDTQAGAVRAMLVIEPCDGPPDLDSLKLTRRYGLTSREFELVRLLSQGYGLRTASARLSMSYQTARFHLRNTFSKMDVHRQSDLVRVVIQENVLHGSPRPRRG